MTSSSRASDAVPDVSPARGTDPGASLVAAGLGRRLGARCVDSLLRLPLAYLTIGLPYFFYLDIWSSSRYDDAAGPAENWIMIWVLGVVLVAYEPVVTWRTGCTLGKLFFGIRVRQRADPAKTPSFGQAMARWAVPTVAGMALLWITWEAIAMLLTDDYGGRGGDIFSIINIFSVIDGGRETPFAENLLAWVLLNAVFYGVVAGLPFMSGVLCLAGRLRRGDGSGLHDKAAGTVVVMRKTVPAAAWESIGSRWNRFSRQLDAEITEQYRADASASDPSAAGFVTEDDPLPMQDEG